MPIIRILTILTAYIVVCAAALFAAKNSLDERFPDAKDDFHCTFSEAVDADADGWPDRWTRERSPTHPRYLDVRIDGTVKREVKGRSLRVQLDGGAAAAYSPAIPVREIYSYVFECLVKTEGLVHDRASMSVTLYNDQDNVLERQVSAPVGTTTSWTRLRIGPVAASSEAAHHAVIGLHLDPGERADLKGTAWFADVWAGHLPRMTLGADSRTHLYVDPQRPTVSCTASGFVDQDAMVDFELLDVAGRELLREKVPLKPDEAIDSFTQSPAPHERLPTDAKSNEPSVVLVGSATWKPPLPGLGYYRVRVSMSGRRDAQHQREIAVAVIRDQKGPTRGEFGWTFSQGEKPLAMDELSNLVPHAGINWLKFPIWDGAADATRNDRLVAFSERLQIEGVEMVGLLIDPPAEVRKNLSDPNQPAAAQVFSSDPAAWYPSLEPIASRLSLKVHWWQLGRDDDQSFINYPKLPATIGRVRKQLGQYGQEVNLGFGWSWLHQQPREKAAWSFLSMSATPPLTAEEEAAYSEHTRDTKVHRWTVLQPLPANQYDSMERARDLSQRMLAAKRQGTDGIFMPTVYSTRHGVMNDDGTIGELFLPWRTTAQALAGAEYVGSLRLKHGSPNHVFSRDRQLVMTLWNDVPCEEAISLGERLRQVDLWGNDTQPVLNEYQQHRIQVGRLPVFLSRLDEPLLRWQMLAAMGQSQWPSVFGVAHANALMLTNPFPQSATGTVRLITPEQWRVVPREIAFKLAAGEVRSLPFEVMLPFDASTGKQDVQMDFDIFVDRRHQFSVYRSVDIGLDDVSIEVATRLNEQGELIVEQKLNNNTEQLVSFKCYLFAPDRRRLFMQVLEQGRGADLKTYRLPQGQDLIGKTLWLRAEEMTGRRMLNYRFVAQP